MKTSFYGAPAVLLGSLFSISSWADALSESGTVEHVLVTIPIHRLESESASPVTVLTGDELRDKVANSIGETLNFSPGLSSASFGPGVGQPIIRGQQGARVTVLQNSTNTADAANTSADHATSVEPILAESIEVLRGPSTLLFGGGAIGGVINVIDSRIPVKRQDTLSGAAEMRHGGVNDENTAVFKLNGGVEQFAFHIDGIARDSNDINLPGFAVREGSEAAEEIHEEDIAFGVLPNTDGSTRSFTLGSSLVFDKGFIGIAFNKLDKSYGIPPGAHEHEEEEGVEEEEEEEELVRLDIRQRRVDIRGDFHPDSAGIEKASGYLTYSDYEHDELEGPEIGTQWRRESTEGRIEVFHAPIFDWHGVIGLQLRSEDYAAVGDESYLPETELRRYGVFIMEDYHIKDWLFEWGARLDSDSLDPVSDGVAIDDESFTSTSVSLSALWKLDAQWSLGAALTQSERAPVIEEVFSNVGNEFGEYVEHVATGVIELAGQDLDSEQANNLDLTLNYNGERVEGFVTYYRNDFRDYIALAATGLDQDGVDIFQYQQQDADFSGVEFELDVLLTNAFDGELRLKLFGDRIKGELDRGDDVARLPASRNGARLDFKVDRFASFVSVVDVAKQDRPGLGEAQTAGYTRWDLGVNYTLGFGDDRNLLTFIRVKNIADEDIRNATSFLRDVAPEPGRSIEAGVRLSF